LSGRSRAYPGSGFGLNDQCPVDYTEASRAGNLLCAIERLFNDPCSDCECHGVQSFVLV